MALCVQYIYFWLSEHFTMELPATLTDSVILQLKSVEQLKSTCGCYATESKLPVFTNNVT